MGDVVAPAQNFFVGDVEGRDVGNLPVGQGAVAAYEVHVDREAIRADFVRDGFEDLRVLLDVVAHQDEVRAVAVSQVQEGVGLVGFAGLRQAAQMNAGVFEVVALQSLQHPAAQEGRRIGEDLEARARLGFPASHERRVAGEEMLAEERVHDGGALVAHVRRFGRVVEVRNDENLLAQRGSRRAGRLRKVGAVGAGCECEQGREKCRCLHAGNSARNPKGSSPTTKSRRPGTTSSVRRPP